MPQPESELNPGGKVDEASREAIVDHWINTRSARKTAAHFGIAPATVRSAVYEAARISRLPETVASDIAGERRRLEIAMDTLWPAVKAGDRKTIETWRKLSAYLRLLNGWIAPPSAGFHVSVNTVQIASGSAKLEALLNDLVALPPPQADKQASEETGEVD
jgi:hypothetical protein